MPSLIFEPLERLAKWLDNGEMKPVFTIRDGKVIRISVNLSENMVKSWTVGDVEQRRVSVL